MTGKLIIKKYPNRRLYNTETCSYVTLRQVADSIRKNRIIKVIDSESEADITPLTLINILMDMAKKGTHVLPISLLHVCVQYGEDDLNDLFISHLENTLQQYIDNRKLLDEGLETFFSFGEKMSKSAMDVVGSNPLFPWIDKDKNK